MPFSLADQIDKACDDFESNWRRRPRITIDESLKQFPPESQKTAFLELLAVEIELRRKDGESPDAADYESRYASFAQEIAAAFSATPAADLSHSRHQDDTSPSPAMRASAAPQQAPGASHEWPREASADLSRTFTFQPVTPPAVIRNRYELRSLLGRGAFGNVFQARDIVLQRIVALKLARSEHFAGTTGRDHFLSEARAAAKLKHPHIVTVFDSGIDERGNPYVIFEYIAGETLTERIRRQRPSRDEAVLLVVAVAQAIHAAHRNGLIHRDLKPSNILLDADGQPHVTDFGLAVDESRQRELAGEVAGSPAYMAPEQIRGEAQYLDGRTDIWALGAILYELLAGRRAFSGRNRTELDDEILHREPKPLRQIDETIPVELEEICLRCLKKSVSERFSSAADVALALQKFRDRSRPRRSSHFRAWVIASAVCLGLALVALSAPWFAASRRPDKLDQPTGPDNTAKNDVSANSESPPKQAVDPLAAPPELEPAPGKWFSALKQPPKLLQWPADSQNARWDLDSDRRELWVSSDRRALLKLGHVESGDYEIQGRLFQSQWNGNICVFFGSHDVVEKGQSLRRLQLIELNCVHRDGPPRNKLRRVVELQEKDGNRRLLDHQIIRSAELPPLSPIEKQLQLTIRAGRLERVRWGDKFLPELTAAESDAQVTAADGFGDWGILVDDASGVFRDFEFFLHPIESP